MKPKRKRAPGKLTLSRRALTGRIDRRLRERDQMLRAHRDRTGATYVVLDVKREAVIETHRDLAALARKLSVLRPWESA